MPRREWWNVTYCCAYDLVIRLFFPPESYGATNKMGKEITIPHCSWISSKGNRALVHWFWEFARWPLSWGRKGCGAKSSWGISVRLRQAHCSSQPASEQSLEKNWEITLQLKWWRSRHIYTRKRPLVRVPCGHLLSETLTQPWISRHS